MSRPSKPVIPTWIEPGHALHLSAPTRARIQRRFDPLGIFLNIPYSRGYCNLEIAIIATVTAYGMTPRMAKERAGMEVRLLKIVELMLSCEFGLTDLSYASRMNMPLEFGSLLAFGKETSVITAERFSALRTVSDLNFCDIYHHGRSIRRLVSGLSRWIEQHAAPTKGLRTRTLMQRYRRLRRIREKLAEDFDRLAPQEVANLLGVTRDEFKMMLLEV